MSRGRRRGRVCRPHALGLARVGAGLRRRRLRGGGRSTRGAQAAHELQRAGAALRRGHRPRYRKAGRSEPMSADYEIKLDAKSGPLTVIDLAAESAGHEQWFNRTLTRVNDAVMPKGISARERMV